jgi:DtxR family Mn-dependent transcriptional regulator
MNSASVQDYLQTIYRLQARQSLASTTAVAAQLGVAPASVTGMVRKLHRQGLVEHVPYRGVALTEAGEREALRILRRHRLWELFLTDVLGLSWDEVHQEAHRLEHATSERVADRLSEFLGEPAVDPHGQPIPARDGGLPPQLSLALAGVQAGQSVQVVEVPDGDVSVLRKLESWGLVPGTKATVLKQRVSSGGTLLEAGGQALLLDQELAGAIRVVPV